MTSDGLPAGAGQAASGRRRSRVLIVDDDADLRGLVADFLSQNAFKVETAACGADMWRVLNRTPVDLVVLDVLLPDADGLGLCARLAGPEGPSIILVSGLGEDVDRIIGLELGADDYLRKPFSLRELLARARAILRWRSRPNLPEESVGVAYEFDGWRLNLIGRELVSPDGAAVALRESDFTLLQTFVERPRRALSRRYLLDASWRDRGEINDRAVDIQVCRIRRKLETAAPGQDLIRTVRGWGYMFNAQVRVKRGRRFREELGLDGASTAREIGPSAASEEAA